MSTPLPAGSSASRRALVAVAMVGAPLCLAGANLILPSTSGAPATVLQTVHLHRAAYLAGSVLSGAGFAQLGAVGVGIAMLLPRRGGVLATVAAVLTLVGGVLMGGAVVTSGFVLSALPANDTAGYAAIAADPATGALFDGAIVAAVGGLLAAIALLIGRPVRIWVPILLVVGLILSNVGGGPLGAVMSIPVLVAVALLAGRLIRGAGRVAAPSERERAMA